MKGTSSSRVIRAVAGYGNQVPLWKVRIFINSLVCESGSLMAIVSVGIDLAKNLFAVYVVDESGKPELVRPNVPRAKLPITLPAACLPLVTIGATVPQIPCWHGPLQGLIQMPDIRLQAFPQQPHHQSVSCLWGGVNI
jgi:hypothetical protein